MPQDFGNRLRFFDLENDPGAWIGIYLGKLSRGRAQPEPVGGNEGIDRRHGTFIQARRVLSLLTRAGLGIRRYNRPVATVR